RQAWPLVGERALICYGDTLANVDLLRLQRRHEQSDGIATISLYRPHNPFGVVKFDRQRRVSSFVEKPRLNQWINIGFILCETAQARPYLDNANDMVEFLSALAAAGKLFAHEH